MTQTLPGPDGKLRCAWCLSTPEYIAYHDDDWGLPIADDQALFERLSLEAFQSGLSWRIILEKRDGFRAAFDGFDPVLVAGFGTIDVQRLLEDPGIVRHRGKIEATITNARRLLEMQQTRSLAAHLWSHEPAPGQGQAAASALSKDLKKRGWAFVGPTTVYAFMQAIGMVNDHAPDCHHHARTEAARAEFVRPVLR